ncbi:MAG TPA: patatin-like phospholipase family protein [bacterium]
MAGQMFVNQIENLRKRLSRITYAGSGSQNGGREKTALCLAGGGITGSMYEIGCLTALEEFIGRPGFVNEFDIYVGTSAGAVVAALIANGYSARALFDDISNDTNSPLNFKRKDIYNLRWREVFKAFAPLFKRLPDLIRYGWVNRRHATLLDLLSIMQEFLPAGIFSLSNLDRFMARMFYPEGKTNDFRNLKKELYIPAVELDSGRRWVFGEEPNKDVPISKAVAASAAIPIFFRPYRIKEHDFIDGSTSKVSHLDVALNHGAKLIVVINPTTPIENDRTRLRIPTFDGQCARLADKGMSFVSEQARRIETKARFEIGFERFKLAHPEADYVVIEPQSSDGILFLHGVMDFDSRKAILNYGYQTTAAELKSNFRAYKQVLEKHKIAIRG